MPPEKPKDAAWERVDAELKRRGKGLQWLADELETSVQRVQNWTTRGLPGKVYADVAAALGESADWIVGLAEPRWKVAPKLPPTDRDRLSVAAVAIGVAYDRMSPAQQDNFVKLLEVAFGASPKERPQELGHSDMMDIDIDITDRQATSARKGTRGTGS